MRHHYALSCHVVPHCATCLLHPQARDNDPRSAADARPDPLGQWTQEPQFAGFGRRARIEKLTLQRSTSPNHTLRPRGSREARPTTRPPACGCESTCTRSTVPTTSALQISPSGGRREGAPSGGRPCFSCRPRFAARTAGGRSAHQSNWYLLRRWNRPRNILLLPHTASRSDQLWRHIPWDHFLPPCKEVQKALKPLPLYNLPNISV